MEPIRQLLEKTLLHYEKKEYDRAEKLVDDLLSASPNFHKGWFLKAVILEETGRAREAEKCYEKAGNVYHMWFRLALQLQEVDPLRAMEYYDRVLREDQKNNMAWLNKGLLYEKMGKTEKAGACFKNLAPGKELFSRLVVPSGFMIFLIGGAVMMIEKGEKNLPVLVIAAAVICFVWLKRDAGTAVKMLLKRKKYGGLG